MKALLRPKSLVDWVKVKLYRFLKLVFVLLQKVAKLVGAIAHQDHNCENAQADPQEGTILFVLIWHQEIERRLVQIKR